MIHKPQFPVPSQTAFKAAMLRQSELTKPPGSLGRLEELAVTLAAWFGEPIPRARPAAALLFAADHGVSHLGVSAYPREVTRAMVHNFLGGGAAACVLARYNAVPLTVIDVGVDGGRIDWEGPDYVRAPVAETTAGDLMTTDAMSAETLDAALDAGREAVRSLVRDTRVVILGEMGIGNTTVASVLAAALLGGDPGDWVGQGTGVSGDTLETKRRVARAAVARVGRECSALELLRRLGGREIAAMVGAMILAAETRRIILVDGFIATAAALVATRLEPGLRPALIFAHRSAESAHERMLKELEATPLLDLQMRLGEGSGALVALSLLDMACRLHAEMATFQSAGVPGQCG